ncbi:helix-turn-helix domain-containing protein [Nocardia alni]|uniref:helix-turn-helix domain-containing protein n=1 Tax=Nocardia alni TaxID=2815723 RepID=UPI001C23A33C|nr:helix-turn-helix transcriptional regulator [Nocardia alni]
MSREVKLGEILSDLIDQGGYRRNRGKICQAVRISPAALSQYLTSRTRPSFEVLVRLADFFGVSLDYLVYGDQIRSSAPPDLGPLVRYVDVSVSRAQEVTRQHSAVVSRVGRVLAEQIDAAVMSAVEGDRPIFAGLLPDDDTTILEMCAEQISIITMDLAADIIVLPDSGQDAAGRYLTIVAQNINAQRRYRFLLPGWLDTDWKELVIRMRNMLIQQCSADSINKCCQFRVTDAPIFSGLGICRLDTASLIMQKPSFFETIRDFVDEDGWISFTLPPSGHFTAHALHDRVHLDNSRKLFEYLWKNSSPL